MVTRRLQRLEGDHGLLPSTWRFLTGGGGEHILFRHPGSTIPNSAGKIGPGVDVRGDGGYIVAPPSEHISGRLYAISVDHHPDEVALADPPLWLLQRLRPQPEIGKPAAEAGDGLARHRRQRDRMEGERNRTLASLTGISCATASTLGGSRPAAGLEPDPVQPAACGCRGGGDRA